MVAPDLAHPPAYYLHYQCDSVEQFCTQLTKTYVTETSCSQLLLIGFAMYHGLHH